jgi:intein/homing endonuclease
MPKVVPDVKQGKGVPTAIQWAREHNIPIAYDGGRYLQVLCPEHNDNVASMSIYADGYYCHSCLHPKQEVITLDGARAAEEVIVGDEIIDGQGNIERITEVHCHQDNKGLVSIKTFSCNIPLIVTKDHPIYIIKNISCEMRESRIGCTADCAERARHKCAKKHWTYINHKITKVNASEVQDIDALVFPISKDTFGERKEFLDVSSLIKPYVKGPRNPRIDMLPLSEDFMWVYGMFLAEGDCYRGGIRFSLHANEVEYANKIKNTLEKLGCKASILSRGPNSQQVICSKTDLVHVFKSLFGVHCENKNIPEEFLNLSKEQQIALLDGIYCGDGTKKDSPRKLITITSKKLSYQMFNLALNLKLFPYFTYCPKRENRKIAYTVLWAKDFDKTSSRSRTYEIIDGVEYYIVPIKDITTIDYNGPVYDITVSGENHSFTTPQGLIGNCHASGGLFSLIKSHTNLTDAEIFEQYKGIKKQKRTMTDEVISLVEENVTLIKDHNNNSFFKLSNISDIGINLLPINSKITRYWVTRLAENALDKLPPAGVLNYVVDYFCGKCMSVGEKTKIYRRIGGNQKEITYDLGNNTFVKITPEAMGIFPDTNLTFIKETNIGVQVVPNKKRRENVLKIFRIINVKDHAQKILLLTWMVTALLPWAQTPILLLCGTRGSGKSFMGRILKRTLDPVEGNSSELLVNKPRDLNYLIGLLSHNAVAVLDNISKIDRETSDILCNVVTGGVIPTRELYTTNDQVLIDIRSKLIITAINSQIFDSGSGDLAERTISIEISRPEDSYLSEEDLVEEYEKCRSEIFGSLLSLVQGYIKEGLPKKGETSGFRLTTYASVGKYISKALGMKTTFDAAYKINQIGLSTNTLEVEPVTDFFIWFAKNFGDKDFNNTRGLGIATDYLFSKFFNEWMSDGGKFGNDRKYPSSANALLTRLKRIEPDLKKIYSISIENKGIHKGKKWLKIKYNGIDDDDDDNNYEEEEEEEWLKTESGGEKQTKIVKDEEGW